MSITVIISLQYRVTQLMMVPVTKNCISFKKDTLFQIRIISTGVFYTGEIKLIMRIIKRSLNPERI
jgi:hypothetical protein